MALPANMDLSQIPAAAPPAGKVPNLVNPPSAENATIAVSSIMMALVVILVSGRLANSLRVTRTISIDDYTSIIAVVLSISFAALDIQQAYTFRHQWNVPASWFDSTKAKVSFSQSILLGPATFFAKASVLLLYLRFFSATDKNFKRKIYVTLAFCFCLYWVNVFLEIALCLPRGGQAWDNPTVLARCQKSLPFAIVQGSLNVCVDFWMLWIPLPIIWQLNMPLRKKRWISVIFMTGILGCVASVVGLAYRVVINNTTDVTWTQNILYLAITCEIDAAIMCSAMPAFASLLKLAVDRRRESRLSSTPHSSGSSHKQSKHKEGNIGPRWLPKLRSRDSYSVIELGDRPPTKNHIVGGIDPVAQPSVEEIRPSCIMKSVAMEVHYDRQRDMV